jgi:hypothetical protein
MRHYKFNVQCASGQWKDFECDATDFRAARRLLDEFIKAN